MSNGHRWSKFWWQDWQNDKCLRMCSIAERGLWMECLCIAHEGEPYGHLRLNGRSLGPADLADMITKTNVKEVTRLLAGLESRGVFSRTEDGTIYSRRMVKDHDQSEEGRADIKRRWGESDGKSRSQRLAEARRKGSHTPDEWQRLCRVFDFRCVRCGRADDTLKDHIVPLYRGGSDAIENLQPLCAKCNRGKGPDQTDHRMVANPDWRSSYEVATNGHDPTQMTSRVTSRVTSRGASDDLDVKRLPEADTDSESEAEANKGRILNLPLGVGPAGARETATSGAPAEVRERPERPADVPTQAQIEADRERFMVGMEGVPRVPAKVEQIAKSLRTQAVRPPGLRPRLEPDEQVNATIARPVVKSCIPKPHELAELRRRCAQQRRLAGGG